MNQETPKSIADVLAVLREERATLAARLDAVELAIDNLQRLWPQGTLQFKAKSAPARKAAKATGDDSEAAARRDLLLTVIGKQEHGATIADLRKLTPKMDPKDRSNALYTLKAQKLIKRSGNAWVKAA